jgi:uncharacterized protein (DUF1800 family)
MTLPHDKDSVRHLGWRAGFGASPALINGWHERHWNRFFQQVMKGAGRKPGTITVPQAADASLEMMAPRRTMSAAERKERGRERRQGMKELNLAWLDEMAATDHPLREKMAFFWHGHFACRVGNVLHNQQLLDVIRQNALGNFGDLLFGVSKSPAMLQFLNNQQNRKQHPNENFGREVMELFTMGHGNYTEEDVKQGSRAFTGWSYDRQGQFVFRKRVHDEGVKTFLGRTGNFDGDDILHIILEQKATARHITRKLCRFFVCDDPGEDLVNELAEKFYQSNYHIGSLMESIFKSDAFGAARNRGNLIKSPIELLVGMRRSVPVDFGRDDIQLLFQRVMDQVLFYPPNVGGWPGGRSWIDSSTLLFRMRLPQIVYYSEEVTTRPKDMPDELTNTYSGKNESDQFIRNFARRVKASAHWDDYLKLFDHVADAGLAEALGDVLLTGPSGSHSVLLNRYADRSSREDCIKSLTIDIMSLPEYQLC